MTSDGTRPPFEEVFTDDLLPAGQALAAPLDPAALALVGGGPVGAVNGTVG